MADNEYNRQEWGAAPPTAPPVDPMGQPRNEATFPLPHVTTFGGQAGWSNRSYLYSFDAASSHSRENAELMRRDPMIDACMRSLTYPVSLLTHSIQPDDDESPAEVDAARRAERNLRNMPGFLFAKHWLVDDGTFVGRTGLKVRWQNVQKRDRVYMLPTAFEPVAGDKLVFKWDGRVGILVRASFPGPTEPVPAGAGRAYILTPADREGMIVYNFEPTDASYWKPQQAGAIKGLGLRDKLYWIWALKMRVWALGMDFLQWFAQGLTVYYFRTGNNEHLNAVKNWVEAQTGQSAMLFPYFAGNEQGFKPIERFEASTASPAFIQQLVTDYFDKLFKEIILGQTLSSGTASTGLGSGVASAHQTTKDERIKYIASALEECLTHDLLGPYYRANEPGIPPGRFVLDLDDPNAQAMIENAAQIVQMGGTVPAEPLLEAGGVPEAKPGQTLLTNVQPTQPAAVGPMPQDVPVANPAPASSQGPVQLSRTAYNRVIRLARNGDRRAAALLRSRRVVVW